MPLSTPVLAHSTSVASPNDGSDRLARAFLQQLVHEERKRLKAGQRFGSDTYDGEFPLDDDAVEQIVAQDEADRPESAHVPIPADLAAVAVMLARAVAAETGLVRRLRREAPVVSLATNVSDLVEPARIVAEKCLFRSQAKIVDLAVGRAGRALTRRHAALFVCDGVGTEARPDKGNEAIRAALHVRIPIVGISPDPVRQLPRDLTRSSEHRIALTNLDQAGLALVIESVAGCMPSREIDPDLLRMIDIADLPVAFRRTGTPDACIEALEKIVAAKANFLGDGPPLEALEGYGEAKTWGLAAAADLQAYRAGRLRWEEIDHRGLLLSGPPGVGKTSFAKALSKSARVPLVATSVAEWNASSYLSGTLQAIHKVFAQARSQAPCILFIDELDGISDRAQIRGEYVQYWTQIVNLFLELLAGVDERPGVVVVAATNHPDRIDPAVKRAGRLDREIEILRPDTKALAQIFRHHIGAGILQDQSTLPLALAARGMTGADVEAFVRRAKGAARRSGRYVTLDDLLIEIRQGRGALSAEERYRVAVHEAGHAIVGHALGFGALVELSLHDDGGQALVSLVGKGAVTLDGLEAALATLLAGRVAEEIELGAGSTGAGLGAASDLAMATNIARNIELSYGFGYLGNIHLDQASGEMVLIAGLLPAITKRLRSASERARVILTERGLALQAIARLLERKGYLSHAEIDCALAANGDRKPCEIITDVAEGQ